MKANKSKTLQACSICQRPLPKGHRRLCARKACKAADNRRRQRVWARKQRNAA